MNMNPFIPFTNDISDYNQVQELGAYTQVEVIYHSGDRSTGKVKDIDWNNSEQDNLPSDIIMYKVIKLINDNDNYTRGIYYGS